MAETKFPLPAFHFSVNFRTGGGEMSFQEVTGLDREVDSIEFRYGHYAAFTKMKRAGLVKTGTVSFKKGIIKGDDKLAKHFENMTNKSHYFSDSGGNSVIKTIMVQLKDEEGGSIVRWEIMNAVPVKLVGPSLNSNTNEVAIEQLDVVYEDIKISF